MGFKFIVVPESENSIARLSIIVIYPILASSEVLVKPECEFWVDSPNGRHLCSVERFGSIFPSTGP